MKIKIMAIIGIILVFFSMNNVSTAAIPTAQRDALIDLYESTSGVSWTTNIGWVSADTEPECTWHGVTCFPPDEYVIEINLNSNGLDGALPDLSGITTLEHLDLNGNTLTGSIPSGLGDLSNLIELNLSDNQLSGTIPTKLGDLSTTSFQTLDLSVNSLSGTIPSTLGKLSGLECLCLQGNMLEGPIPSTLADNLTNMVNNESDFRWNALYTDDTALITTLNTWQSGGNYASTQTIAPKNFRVFQGADDESMVLTWTPVNYTADPGGYEIEYRYSDDSWPSTPQIEIPDKSASTDTITGLISGTDYEFRIRSYTDIHSSNNNRVVSEYATKSGKTSGDPPDDVGGGCFIGSALFNSSELK